MSVADDLRRAAEIMDERGKCEGVFEREGRVCALGAIAQAVNPNVREGYGYFNVLADERAQAAVDALARHLGGTIDTNSDGWSHGWFSRQTVYSYNDHLKGLFKKRKMVKTFKQAAKELT